MKHWLFITISCLYACLLPNSAQEVTINAGLDTTKALIGDQLKLHLSVSKPENVLIDFPHLKDTLSDKIEIIKVFEVDTSVEPDGKIRLERNLLISVFDTGFFEVPPLRFVVRDLLQQDTIHTLPVYFEILPVQTDSTIRDIKNIYRVPIGINELAPYLLGLIVAGIVIWFLTRYIRKRDTGILHKPTGKPAELAEVIALRDLETIKAEKPWMHNQVKSYYIRLSEILRLYIEGRYQITALEQTTDEIMNALKPPVCIAIEHKRLVDILKLADLVKFAKVIPGVGENELQVDEAIKFVKNTVVHDNMDLTDTDHKQRVVNNNIPT
jgi:hypothetical protein